MPCRSHSFAALRHTFAALLATFAATLAHATPKPLDETEMSAVRGADGSILVGVQPSSSNSQNPFASGLAAAFSSSTGSTTLTPTQFASALQAAGLSPTMFADYAGQPVAQTAVDARPATFSFDFSDVLQTLTGLQYNAGAAGGAPSMGTITLKDFDARGSTLWVWHH
jgi:hypothetical protein